MRTKTLVLAAAISAASLATSMAQVYSVNAVGYVNVTVKKGYNFVANPLKNGGNTLAEILPPATTSLPSFAFVSTWDPTRGAIGGLNPDTPTFYAPEPGFEGAWDPAGPAIPPGQGFFIYIPPSAPQDSYTITFVGEVATGTLSTPIYGKNRYNALASQVPQAGKVTTDLGLTPAPDDMAMMWNKNATPPGYNPVTLVYTEGAGWNDGANLVEPELGVGDAFFLLRVADVVQPWSRTFNVNQ